MCAFIIGPQCGRSLGVVRRVDKQAPTVPTKFNVRPASPSRMELRWDASSDNFLVAGYRINRNGIAVGTNEGPWCYLDEGLSAGTTYSYSIQALDPAGNVSPESTIVTTNTPGAGSPLDIVTDDADGPPWVSAAGRWNQRADVAGYYSKGFSTRSSLNPPGAVTFTFTPNLPEPGDYQVYVWNPGSRQIAPQLSTNSPVDIVHGG